VVEACFRIIVEYNEECKHQAAYVVGDLLEEYSSNGHMASMGAELVGGDDSKLGGPVKHSVAESDSEEHVHRAVK